MGSEMCIRDRDSRSTLRALGHVRESPGRAGRNCGPSDTGRNPLEQLVDTAGPQSLVQDAKDSWSTSQALGPWPLSPGTTGLPRGSSDPIASRTGVLVDPAGPPT